MSTILSRGRSIDRWEPDNEAFWEAEGRTIARKNLIFSIFAEHIGFSIWVLWTIVVLNLDADLTLSETFWLTAVPNLVGSALRLPYTFAVPRFGGRVWTTFSAGMLLLPATLVAVVVPSGWLAAQSHDTQFWVLLACAATAGVGGGNFSSSMANISFFYPEKRKGFALGLNAAGGNLGVAVTQLAVPLVVLGGLAWAGLMWIPFVLAAAFGAWRYMDNLTQMRTDKAAYARALRQPQTWLTSILYIGTFGSFIGFSFALPLVIKNTFPEFLAQHTFIADKLAGLAFTGALIGSIARPLGGWLSDRVGGARVTLGCFLGMGAFTAAAIAGVERHSFALFFGSFMGIFLLAGAGNGSTYRMIPSIFAELGRRAGGSEETMLDFKRQAAAVIGIAGAIGAFGGFIIQVVLRQASLGVSALVKAAETPAEKLAVAQAHADWAVPALVAFLVAYGVFAGMTWFLYLRRRLAVSRVPSLAEAAI
ncbi:MAG TPA: nitrate/nitrite transporter [Casimicrobiaceae bacterium]